VRSSRPSVRLQYFTVPSIERVKATFPSGENATPITPSVCPMSLMTCLRDDQSHRMAVSSRLPVRRNRPSGENATAVTAAVCPRRAPTIFAVARSTIAVTPVAVPIAVILPSGETASDAPCNSHDSAET
jgi:hypothetical protein